MLPRISVLIAARNEEANIVRCLASLHALSYPAEHLEILIGDDRSEDRTAALTEAFIADKPVFTLLRISTNLGQIQGKANVLAQLARYAKGEYFLMTDADIAVAPGWVEYMLAAFQPGMGIVNGFTVIEGKSWFARLQSLDWISGQSFIHLGARFGIPFTAMGNNMMVSREAYFSVGGYEGIPFTVVEDFTLFHAMLRKGWKFGVCCHPGLVTRSLPVPDFPSLLRQRRRWMKGVLALPPLTLTGILLQALFLPLMLCLMFYSPLAAGLWWMARFIFQSVLFSVFMVESRQLHLLPLLPLHELYTIVFQPFLLVYAMISRKIMWKGRTY